MKKMLFPLLIICFAMGCNNKKTGTSEKGKKNLESANAVAKMFETGDISKMDDYFAKDVVDHAGMNGDVVGIDSLKASFKIYQSMMKDAKNETAKELADDDYTFQWFKESWTATKDEMGMKAGEKMSMNVVEVSRFNSDGKITEHWSFLDVRDMMKMMGGANAPMMDSVKTTKPVSMKMNK
ncbi:MAG: hypothetical protein C4308_02745 [Chitinophagaceae bacterium]